MKKDLRKGKCDRFRRDSEPFSAIMEKFLCFVFCFFVYVPRRFSFFPLSWNVVKLYDSTFFVRRLKIWMEDVERTHSVSISTTIQPLTSMGEPFTLRKWCILWRRRLCFFFSSAVMMNIMAKYGAQSSLPSSLSLSGWKGKGNEHLSFEFWH